MSNSSPSPIKRVNHLELKNEIKSLASLAQADIEARIEPIMAEWKDREISFPFVLMMGLIEHVLAEGWTKEEIINDVANICDIREAITMNGAKH